VGLRHGVLLFRSGTVRGVKGEARDDVVGADVNRVC